MQAIVFCKTHEMMMVLQKWIKQTELEVLSSNHVVGTKTSAKKGGMNWREEAVVTEILGQTLHAIYSFVQNNILLMLFLTC